VRRGRSFVAGIIFGLRSFVAGLVLGLALASGSTVVANWDWTDQDLLARLTKAVEFVGAQVRESNEVAKKRLEAEQWQARSLQRIVWVLERQFPAPAESSTKKGE
jgi:hypothetical protein